MDEILKIKVTKSNKSTTYEVSEDGTMITLTVTDANGNTTEITIPIGSFTF